MNHTITTPAREEAGLVAACAKHNELNGTAFTPDEYLAARNSELLTAYADAHNVGIITPYAFVARFTPAEYARIVELAATDPILAGFLGRLAEVSAVHLFSDEVAQGVGYLTAFPSGNPILAQGRAAEITS